MLRRLAPVLLLGACAPAPTPDPVPPVASRAALGTSCSAASLAPPSAQPVLTEAAARTRDRIVSAARACDVDALADLAPPGFTHSFGGGDAAASWRAAEARGEPVLATLVRLLTLEPRAEDGRFVWPRAFAASPPPDARGELERAFGADTVAGWYVDDQYLGWRTAIGVDGRWGFFVAGD